MHNESPIPLPKFQSRSFTLIELIVVIIIVGILAAVGLSQYSVVVEKSRLAEARVRVSTISKLAYEHYLENGTFVGITNEGMGIADFSCHATDFYRYDADETYANQMFIYAYRCTSGGKPPQGPDYGLIWRVGSDGSLSQYQFKTSTSSWSAPYANWGGCCR